MLSPNGILVLLLRLLTTSITQSTQILWFTKWSNNCMYLAPQTEQFKWFERSCSSRKARQWRAVMKERRTIYTSKRWKYSARGQQSHKSLEEEIKALGNKKNESDTWSGCFDKVLHPCSRIIEEGQCDRLSYTNLTQRIESGLWKVWKISQGRTVTLTSSFVTNFEKPDTWILSISTWTSLFCM